jgi:hypothetical protein
MSLLTPYNKPSRLSGKLKLSCKIKASNLKEQIEINLQKSNANHDFGKLAS